MKTSSNRRWRCLFLLMTVLCPMIFPVSTLGQADNVAEAAGAWPLQLAQGPVRPVRPRPQRGPLYYRQEAISREPVKLGFQSWSLFLVCNPTWLLTENRERLWNLYHKFDAFGRAIGPENLAVWFWKSRPQRLVPGARRGRSPPTLLSLFPDQDTSVANTALADYVDVDRSSQYCAKFKLLPSESPHVLVTTMYPDLGARAGDYVVLRLSNASSSDITTFLSKLSDQLVVEGLN